MEKKVRTYISRAYDPKIGEHAYIRAMTSEGVIETLKTSTVEHTVSYPDGTMDIVTRNSIYKQERK